MGLQKPITDYLDEDDEAVEIGKSIRNATYSMIKPHLSECRMRVYEIILKFPGGITRKGIADELGWRDRSVTGRVTELLNLNLIKEEGIEYTPSHDGRMYPNGLVKPV